EFDPISLEPADDRGVLLGSLRSLIQASGLQDLGVTDVGDGDRHLVAEVRIGLPADGALGDRLHRSPGVLDLDLLGAWPIGPASDTAGVEEEDLEAARIQERG